MHASAFMFYHGALNYEVGIFFFQAEDGIRDPLVTGVQTCALPIFARAEFSAATPRRRQIDGRSPLLFRGRVGRAAADAELDSRASSASSNAAGSFEQQRDVTQRVPSRDGTRRVNGVAANCAVNGRSCSEAECAPIIFEPDTSRVRREVIDDEFRDK